MPLAGSDKLDSSLSELELEARVRVRGTANRDWPRLPSSTRRRAATVTRRPGRRDRDGRPGSFTEATVTLGGRARRRAPGVPADRLRLRRLGVDPGDSDWVGTCFISKVRSACSAYFFKDYIFCMFCRFYHDCIFRIILWTHVISWFYWNDRFFILYNIFCIFCNIFYCIFIAYFTAYLTYLTYLCAFF